MHPYLKEKAGGDWTERGARDMFQDLYSSKLSLDTHSVFIIKQVLKGRGGRYIVLNVVVGR